MSGRRLLSKPSTGYERAIFDPCPSAMQALFSRNISGRSSRCDEPNYRGSPKHSLTSYPPNAWFRSAVSACRRRHSHQRVQESPLQRNIHHSQEAQITPPRPSQRPGRAIRRQSRVIASVARLLQPDEADTRLSVLRADCCRWGECIAVSQRNRSSRA